MKVVAKDNLVKDLTQEASVHVIAPHQLEMEIIDVTEEVSRSSVTHVSQQYFLKKNQNEEPIFEPKWVLITQRYYIVKVHLFGRFKRQIELTDNLKFEVGFDNAHVSVLESNS